MGNFSQYKKYFIVFLGLIVSYYISIFFIKTIFLANSPKIRPNLGSYLAFKFKNTTDNLLAKITINFPTFPKKQNLEIATTQSSTEQPMMNFLKGSLKPVAKGVSAASKDGYNYYEFKLNEIEWVMIEYTLKNGEIIKIRYPKGTNPPPKEIYEE